MIGKGFMEMLGAAVAEFLPDSLRHTALGETPAEAMRVRVW